VIVRHIKKQVRDVCIVYVCVCGGLCVGMCADGYTGWYGEDTGEPRPPVMVRARDRSLSNRWTQYRATLEILKGIVEMVLGACGAGCLSRAECGVAHRVMARG
jgi:hypothetical protein